MALAEAHAAAGGMEADAEAARLVELHVQELARSRPREHVEMVGRRRASAEEQFAEGDLGADADGFGGEAAPDLVEPGEPVEQLGVLDARQVARQGLIEVVMSVDEARVGHAPAAVQHTGDGRRGQRGADGLDASVRQHDVHIVQHAVFAVHRDERVDVLNLDGLCHGKLLPGGARPVCLHPSLSPSVVRQQNHGQLPPLPQPVSQGAAGRKRGHGAAGSDIFVTSAGTPLPATARCATLRAERRGSERSAPSFPVHRRNPP